MTEINLPFLRNLVWRVVLTSAVFPLSLIILLTSCMAQEGQENLPVICQLIEAKRLDIGESTILLDGKVIGKRVSHEEKKFSDALEQEGFNRKIAAALGSSDFTSYEVIEISPGIVFVCGGLLTINGKSRPIKNTWLYNFEHHSLKNGPALNHARWGHRLSKLPDGSVIVVGGDKVLDVERFDPSKAVMKNIGKLSEYRSDFGIVALNKSTLLLAGGISYGDPSAGPEGEISSLETFSVYTGQGSLIGRMNERRIDPDCLRLQNGMVVIAGGSRVIYPQSEPQRLSSGDLLRGW